MGQIIPHSITQFDTGMVNDPRSPVGARLIKGFDALTFPYKLVPFRSSESGNDGIAVTSIRDFLYAEGKTYAVGLDASTGKTAVVSRSTYTDGAWTTPANNKSSTFAAATVGHCFVYYKNAIYGAMGSVNLFKFLTSGGGFTENDVALSYTTIAQGVVCSKDDILYIPYDNKIAKNNAGSWTTAALTLPTDCTLTSICEYGNYIAIGAQRTAGANVYLWNRDDSLSTLSESINWGPETLQVLEEVVGELLGISTSSNMFQPRLIFKRYAGSAGAQQIMELAGDVGTSISLYQYKQKLNGRLFFQASITIDGTVHYGVWSFGKNLEGRYTLTLERLPNNDTNPTSISSFLLVGDYTFIAYNDGVNDQVSKTDDSAFGFTATATYETTIFNHVLGLRNKHIPDSSVSKKVIGVTVTTETMPTNGQITLQYKALLNGVDSGWVTIFVNTTDSSMFHHATTIESTGATLPAYNEIRFRILSTGGAVPTGFKFEAEIIPDAPY